MTTVFIGIGSNQEHPLQQVQTASKELAELAINITSFRCSSIYESLPMGPQDQDNYFNAVCQFDTLNTPSILLNQLFEIEQLHGRVRQENLRWGPRTLDLDLLLYGEQQINLPKLTVPHYGMKQRIFVLQPLFDLFPDYIFPDGESIHSALQRIQDETLHPIS